MKNKTLILMYILLVYGVFAQVNINPIKFYIPSGAEVNAYINLQKYLAKCNSSNVEMDDKVLLNIFKLSFKYDNILQTYLIEAFLRNTKNISVQMAYKEYLKAHSIETEETKKILLIWGQKSYVKSNAEAYDLENGKRYEYINLTGLQDIGFFDNHLYLTVPNNEWNILSFNKEPRFLIFGGGTNSMSISVKKYNCSIDDFKNHINDDKIKYGNEVIRELEINDFLKLCNSNYMVIKYGCENDNGSYLSGNIDLYLYSMQLGNGYKVSYFMNFSDINILADEAPRIYSFLSEMILFSWIE
jgi:hypothetical protein